MYHRFCHLLVTLTHAISTHSLAQWHRSGWTRACWHPASVSWVLEVEVCSTAPSPWHFLNTPPIINPTSRLVLRTFFLFFSLLPVSVYSEVLDILSHHGHQISGRRASTSHTCFYCFILPQQFYLLTLIFFSNVCPVLYELPRSRHSDGLCPCCSLLPSAAYRVAAA